MKSPSIAILLACALAYPAVAVVTPAMAADPVKAEAKPEAKPAEELNGQELVDRFSYLQGVLLGKSLADNKEDINAEQFLKGINEGIAGKSNASEKDVEGLAMKMYLRRLDRELAKATAAKDEGQITMLTAQKKALENELSRAKQAEVQAKQGRDFLEKNKTAAGVKVTPSGLQYQVVSEGKGEKPKATDTVTVHYTGKLLDGTTFDSSVESGKPVSFPLNGVIKGWTEGLQLMPVGSKFKFFIPPELAYGERGVSSIPPNSVLVFDVELIKIEPPAAAPAGGK